MDKDLQKFIKEARKISLKDSEKSAMRQSVLNFAKQNPVRMSENDRLGLWSTIFTNKLNFNPIMTLLLIASLLVGGGVAVGAENSLPGDVLYPVKIGVNEEVRSWLSISEEARASWEVQRAERRLEEAEALAEKGELETEVREKIELNFENHAEKVKDRIRRFEDKEDFEAAVDVSSKFETSLKAHQKILDRLSVEAHEKLKKEVGPIRVRVNSETNAAVEVRERIESRIRARILEETSSEEDNSIDSETKVQTRVKSEDDSVEGNVELRLRLGN